MSDETLRFERCLPADFRRAMKRNPLVFLPLGAVEWHGEHLPVGLDSLTAHGLCLRAASRVGGLVYPPLYYGMTGSIWHHPWTILVEEEEILLKLLELTLSRLQDCGVRKALVFTGHFAKKQLALLETLERRWAEREGSGLRLSTLSISSMPDSPMAPDHGAIFETSVLFALKPNLVNLERLPSVEEQPAEDPKGNSKGAHRRDPENVLFGILGDDPRLLDATRARQLAGQLEDWLSAEALKLD